MQNLKDKLCAIGGYQVSLSPSIYSDMHVSPEAALLAGAPRFFFNHDGAKLVVLLMGFVEAHTAPQNTTSAGIF